MARGVQALGVRPELEVFDTGHLVMVKELIGDGLIDDPVLIQLCTGIPYGAPSDIPTLMAMVNQLPSGAIFSAFSIGRLQLPFVAMAALAGGNVRVGLEDNIYLSRGVLAGNGRSRRARRADPRRDERPHPQPGRDARAARARAALSPALRGRCADPAAAATGAASGRRAGPRACRS